MDDFDDFDDDPYFWRFRRTKPKAVKGGIRAQTKKFGNQWWGVKWLEAIEKFGPSKRVARGRSYARKGQVLDLQFEPGLISSKVQGSRETPYEVKIFLERLSPERQKDILHELHTQPIYAATLLTGEVHPDVENLFQRHNFPLFPTKSEGLRSSCSCPDNSNPCKHMAAVYYLISEELERDPFLLLHLRGIKKEQLTSQKQSELFDFPQFEPLPTDPNQFWRAPRVKEIPVLSTETPKPARPAILQRLGSFPFWRGEEDFLRTMERIYRAARDKVK